MTSFQGKVMTGNGNLIATIDNRNYQVTSEHMSYSDLFEAFKNNDAEAFVRLYDVKQRVESYCTDGVGVVVDGERVLYNGVELNNAIVDTIKNMMRHDLDPAPMVKFLERAINMGGGSYRVLHELWNFIEACGLTVTEDGCFLAYKTVNDDYTDKYSGRFENVVGAEHRMPRFEVDDNCERHCSHGFHVGGLAYAGPGGWYNGPNDKVLICKVAPEDVVSVPTDHSFQKLRCCAYTVVGEYVEPLDKTVYSGRVGDTYSRPQSDVESVQIEYRAEDMMIDEMFSAMYKGEERYFLVLEHDEENRSVLVELLYPEENEGGLRRFKYDHLTDVEEYCPDDYEEDDEDDEDDVHPDIW